MGWWKIRAKPIWTLRRIIQPAGKAHFVRPALRRSREAGLKPSREQFEALALEQLDLLYRVARRMTRNQAAAEDLVQETYLRAIRAWDRFDLQEHGMRPWLLRILHNLYITRGERESRQPATIPDEQLGTAARTTGSAWSFEGRQGMDQTLVRAIDALPMDYQVVMLLWAVEEMSYKEIAEAVDIPIGTVMSRLHRARQRLSEQLRDFAIKEGVIRE